MALLRSRWWIGSIRRPARRRYRTQGVSLALGDLSSLAFCEHVEELVCLGDVKRGALAPTLPSSLDHRSICNSTTAAEYEGPLRLTSCILSLGKARDEDRSRTEV